MSYIFSDQQSKLSVLIGDSNTSTDDAFPLAIRKKEINRGELHFARDTKALREYATGTVASQQISLPSDWIENHVLVVNDKIVSNSLEKSLSDYERYYNDTSEYFYYVWEVSGTRYIKFFTTAADGLTYKLWYFKKPTTELSADADVSLFPEEYREASVYFAAAELMEQIGKTELSDRYRQVYAQYVARASVDVVKSYVNREYPQPDLDQSNANTGSLDVQGKGYIF